MIVSMSMEKELVERFDSAIKSRGYSTRSEAMRELVRDSYRIVSGTSKKRIA